MALVPASNRGTDPSAAVDSVFGRTGVVVAAAGDYTAAQVTNAADKASAAAQVFTAKLQTPQITVGDTSTGIQSAGGILQTTAGVSMQVGGTLTTSSAAAAVRQLVLDSGPNGPIQKFSTSDTTVQLSRTAVGVLTTNAAFVAAGIAGNPITSGALPTVSPSSGTAFQTSTTRDTDLVVPVTYNGAAADATCKVEISPDNTTFSTLGTATEKLGSVNGDIRLLTVHVPAGWYVKLTVANATIGTGTYY